MQINQEEVVSNILNTISLQEQLKKDPTNVKLETEHYESKCKVFKELGVDTESLISLSKDEISKRIVDAKINLLAIYKGHSTHPGINNKKLLCEVCQLIVGFNNLGENMGINGDEKDEREFEESKPNQKSM